MYDPTRHVVVDANVLAAFFHPASTHSTTVRERARILLEAALTSHWPGLRLYTPGICIAESLAVLDKYRFCKWQGPVKQDASKELSASDYEHSRTMLSQAVKERIIEELEHEPQHVLLAGLLSPVNCRYQIRRKRRTGRHRKDTGGHSKVKPPMSATDCLIAGLSIHLAQRLGRHSVILATGDQRLADVLAKARRLRRDKAEELGLIVAAENAGLAWSCDIYPNVVDLQRASDSQMRTALGGWPLPTTSLAVKSRQELTRYERERLSCAWLAVATENNITNPDGIAYSPILEDIRARFALDTSTYLSSKEVFLFLLGERKAARLPKPSSDDAEDNAPERLPLFPIEDD